MEACDRCGAEDVEIHHSGIAHLWLCEGCYLGLSAAKERGGSGNRKRPVTPVPMVAHTRYERFVGTLWRKLEYLTGHSPFYLSATQIVSYCPVCERGTVLWTMRDFTSAPGVDVSSQARGPGYCSLGCTEAKIGDLLYATP